MIIAAIIWLKYSIDGVEKVSGDLELIQLLTLTQGNEIINIYCHVIACCLMACLQQCSKLLL